MASSRLGRRRAGSGTGRPRRGSRRHWLKNGETEVKISREKYGRHTMLDAHYRVVERRGGRDGKVTFKREEPAIPSRPLQREEVRKLYRQRNPMHQKPIFR